MKTITLHRDAPPQPHPGEPCNGCGVCCAARPCPTGILLFRQTHGTCPALFWQTGQGRYVCGLIETPCQHLPWLPHRLVTPARSWFSRSIAAGRGCDCFIELDEG